MSWPTFAVLVTKMTRKPPHTVELRLTSLSGAVSMELWPDLALRVLADPEGSPLRERPLYDDATAAALAAEFIGDVLLLSCKGGVATYQIPIQSDVLAACLQKGQTWETQHRPTRWPVPIDGAWSADGKTVLVGLDSGVAQLIAVTKKGIGSTRALLNHPGLVAVDAGADGLLTAGRSTVQRWDTAGKTVQATHTVSGTIVAARFLGASVAVGCADGAVLLVDAAGSAQVLVAAGAGAGAVVALATSASRVAVATADGTVTEWDAAGVLVATHADAHATALAYAADGTLLVGRDDHAVQAGAQRLSLPATSHLPLYHGVYHPGRAELLAAAEGRISVVSVETGAVQELAETGAVYQVQQSPSGQYRVALSDSPAGFYLWDAEGRLRWRLLGTPLAPVQRNLHPPIIACFSPAERHVALHCRDASHKDGAVVVLEVEGGGSVVLPNSNARYAWVESIAWLDEDRLLVSYSNEPDKVWTLSTRSFAIHDENNFSAQVVRTDGGIVCCVPRPFDTDFFHLLRTDDLSVTAVFPLDGLFGSSYPPTVQPSRDGQRALLSNPFQDIVVVTPETEGPPWRLADTRNTYNDVRLSPSGRWMVVQRKDKHVDIWDVMARTVHATAPLDYAQFSFSPDEESILCLDGTQVRRLRLDGTFSMVLSAPVGTRATGSVSAVCMLPDGTVCASVGALLHCLKGGSVRSARYPGRAVVSPDQAQALVLTDRGPVTVALNML